MKKHIILLTLLALPLFVLAQTDATNKKGSSLKMTQYNDDEDDDEATDETPVANEKREIKPGTLMRSARTGDDPLSSTIMNVADGWANFQNLPYNSNIEVYITNQEGTIMLQKTLMGNKTDVDLHRLRSGFYFVTLTAGGYRKSFTMEWSQPAKR